MESISIIGGVAIQKHDHGNLSGIDIPWFNRNCLRFNQLGDLASVTNSQLPVGSIQDSDGEL